MKIKIDLSEVTELLAKVENIDRELDWGPAGQIAESSIKQNFEEGGRYNTPQDPIGGSKKWQDRKKEPEPWHPILIDTEALKNSVGYETQEDGVEVYSRGVAYNRAQNLGYAANNLVPRPFMNISPSDLDKITKNIDGQITDILN